MYHTGLYKRDKRLFGGKILQIFMYLSILLVLVTCFWCGLFFRCWLRASGAGQVRGICNWLGLRRRLVLDVYVTDGVNKILWYGRYSGWRSESFGFEKGHICGKVAFVNKLQVMRCSQNEAYFIAHCFYGRPG